MTYTHSGIAKFCLATIALLSWTAIVLQLYILIANSNLELVSTIIHFFSFFTILSNLLVAIYSIVSLFYYSSFTNRAVTGSLISTAITVYIIVVGLVYNTVLRQLWHPEGLQKLVDETLHLLVPFLFVIYWFLFSPKGELHWKDSFKILLFPFLYLLYTLAHGVISGFYPYPFVNAKELGYGKVIMNSAVLCVLFWLLSLGLIAAGRKLKK